MFSLVPCQSNFNCICRTKRRKQTGSLRTLNCSLTGHKLEKLRNTKLKTDFKITKVEKLNCHVVIGTKLLYA